MEDVKTKVGQDNQEGIIICPKCLRGYIEDYPSWKKEGKIPCNEYTKCCSHPEILIHDIDEYRKSKEPRPKHLRA